MNASISGLACSRAEIWFSCSVGSASSPTNSEITSPSNVSARPSQRSSRAMLVCSWRPQRIVVTPSSLKRSPGALAGDDLVLADVGDGAELLPVVEPGVERVQRDAGFDDRLAAAAETPSGSASEIAIPSEPSAMAASMACDCASASLFEPKYVTSTPRSAAACSTAFWTTAQNTPSSPWVMTWKCRSSPCDTSTVSPGAAGGPGCFGPRGRALGAAGGGPGVTGRGVRSAGGRCGAPGVRRRCPPPSRRRRPCTRRRRASRRPAPTLRNGIASDQWIPLWLLVVG